MSDIVRCSDASLAAGEEPAGSAPFAPAWVALEQSGPWGARALTQSRLDPRLGAALEAAAAASGTRPVLIRRPGRHASTAADGDDDPRRLLVAFTRPDQTWLLEGTIGRPADVLKLDWAALAHGDRDAVRRSAPPLEPSFRAHLLVCTNGARDLCCAVKGRPIAGDLAVAHPGRVWEVTHTSGHRFAPTAVLLPAGTVHGRIDAAFGSDLLDAAARGETLLAGHRGRSTWPGPAQVAMLAVRTAAAERSLVALAVTGHQTVDEHAWVTDVQHRDGRRWRVCVRSEATDVARGESCGKTLKALRRYTTTLTRL